MPVIINEVIVRAVIAGENSVQQQTEGSGEATETILTITKKELLDLMEDFINDKKER